MEDKAIVEMLGTRVMGWESGPVYGTNSEVVGLWFADGIDSHHTRYYVPYPENNSFDPLTSISDAFMVQAEIEKDQHLKKKYCDAMFSQIAGSLEIVGSLKIQWGMLNATPRQRCLAALSAIEAK